MSYLDRKISFEGSVAENLIGSAAEHEGKAVEANKFLRDLHESVSILIRDVTVYSFLHRSFQEYFVALFLIDRQIKNIERLYRRVFNQGEYSDAIFDLLIEMNRDAFESRFFIKEVSKMRREADSLLDAHSYAKLLSMFALKVNLFEGRVRGILFGKWQAIYATMIKYYSVPHEGNFIIRLFRLFEGVQPVMNGMSEIKRSGVGSDNCDIMVATLSDSFIEKSSLMKGVTEIVENVRAVDDELRKKSNKKGDFALKVLRHLY